jgi:hypothetical protein
MDGYFTVEASEFLCGKRDVVTILNSPQRGSGEYDIS